VHAEACTTDADVVLRADNASMPTLTKHTSSSRAAAPAVSAACALHPVLEMQASSQQSQLAG
jgi:hypothetical protein